MADIIGSVAMVEMATGVETVAGIEATSLLKEETRVEVRGVCRKE